LPLESGKELSEFQLEYEIYGEFDPTRVILLCHALSGSAHAAGEKGWWDSMIGPGKALDTDRFCVICSNTLGGCGGSTGPSSVCGEDGRPWALRFPVISINDMVAAQLRLVDHLGIEKLHAVVGGCLGGAQALTWLQRHPDRVARATAIGITDATSPHSLAFYEVLRQSLRLDPAYGDGDYYDQGTPTSGMGLNARVGMLFWMTPAVMEARYGRRLLNSDYRYTLEPEFAIHEGMDALGRGLGRRFDPNTMIYLTRAMDYYDLSRGYSDLSEALDRVDHPVQLISYHTDWRYPPAKVERLCQCLKNGHHVTLDSTLGHGAWLFETGSLQPLIKNFLSPDP
jgi:homoserine O-acetyltransferase/O-succinyltransferase